MINRFSWFRLCRNSFFYSAPWIAIGLLTSSLTLALLVGAVLALVWNYWHIYRLNQWLWIKRSLLPPQSSGVWGTVFDGVFGLQKKQRTRRKTLGELIKRFREGSEALPDATVVFRDDFRIVWCNKLAQEVLGLRWPDDAGNRIDNLLRQPQMIAYFNKKTFDEPLTIPSPVLPGVVIELRVMPYSENQYLLMARDVTRIELLEKTRKNFVANVSHELRTPLTVIQGYLEMTKEGNLPDAMHKKAHDMMISQATRMEGLIEQLLTLSKIEMNSSVNAYEPVNVGQLIAATTQDARVLSGERNHDIQLHLETEEQVNGISHELQSVFSNLIYNAVRYTPDGGNIDIYWRERGSELEFSVEDSGDGIPAQHLSRLTERFYRVDPARSRDTGGSGLGLSIVKHALLHHKSELLIDSAVGKGSTFSCRFPSSLKLQ